MSFVKYFRASQFTKFSNLSSFDAISCYFRAYSVNPSASTCGNLWIPVTSDHQQFLRDELATVFPKSSHKAVKGNYIKSSKIRADSHPNSPLVAFAVQFLPNSIKCEATTRAVVEQLENQLKYHKGPWRIHLLHGNKTLAKSDKSLIVSKAIAQLKRKKNPLVKQLNTKKNNFAPDEALIQISYIPWGKPFENVLVSCALPDLLQKLNRLISPFPAGVISIVGEDGYQTLRNSSPSSAFKKLLEVERRLGQRIKERELVVDLGCSPGGWSSVGLLRNAKVIGYDVSKSEMNKTILENENFTFNKQNVFNLEKLPENIDWLIYDVLSTPEKSIQFFKKWIIEQKICKNFIVTIKFTGSEHYQIIQEAKDLLYNAENIEYYDCKKLTNGKNEICFFGTIKS